MVETLVFSFIALWIICGFFAYGMTFAYFRGRFPHKNNEESDKKFALQIASFGIIGLMVAFLTSGHARYGFRWK
jgi:hypothetical protein